MERVGRRFVKRVGLRVLLRLLRLLLEVRELAPVVDGGEDLPQEDGEHANPDDPAGDPDDHPEVVRFVVHGAHGLLVVLLQVQ